MSRPTPAGIQPKHLRRQLAHWPFPRALRAGTHGVVESRPRWRRHAVAAQPRAPELASGRRSTSGSPQAHHPPASAGRMVCRGEEIGDAPWEAIGTVVARAQVPSAAAVRGRPLDRRMTGAAAGSGPSFSRSRPPSPLPVPTTRHGRARWRRRRTGSPRRSGPARWRTKPDLPDHPRARLRCHLHGWAR